MAEEDVSEVQTSDDAGTGDSATPTETTEQGASQAEEGADSATATDENPENTENTEKKEKGAEPTGAEKRIKQLAAERKEERQARFKAEQEAAYYRGLAEGRKATEPEKPAKPELKEPDLDEFESTLDYQRARDEYLVSLAEERAVKRFEDRMASEETKKAEARFRTRVTETFDKAIEKIPDFEEKTEGLVAAMNAVKTPGSIAMAAAFVNNENGPELAYHLAHNPVKAHEMMAMSPDKAFMELGRLSAEISRHPAPIKKPSTAPPPVSSVVGGRGAVEKDLSKLNTTDYIEEMKRRDREKVR